MNPFFSIILPTYNRSKFIPIAIDSVVKQTFKDWELIIVDDGSIDNTREIVEAYKESRIIYIYQQNQERCAARNNGINNAKGKYICFLDDDDYYMPNRLELLYNNIIELKEPCVFLYTGICIEKNGIVKVRPENLFEEYSNKYDFFMHSHIHSQQTCIAKEILLKHKFNPMFKIGEDTELWFRLISDYEMIFINNQNTVVITDHEYRSINVSINNVYSDVLKFFSYVRKQFKYPFSIETIKYMKTDGHFGIAKYYIYQKKRLNAIYHLLLSLIYDVHHKQFKYRTFIIINLIFKYDKALSLIKE